MKLAKRILFALAFGVIVGIIINSFFPSVFKPLDGYVFTPLGTIFLNLIKMLVVPLVFFSIVTGVANIGDPKKLGRIGVKTITFFLTTTAIAITIAIILALILKPGLAGSFSTENLEYKATTAPPASETFLGIIPTNPIEAMASGSMLQIIFFAVFVGLAISLLGKKVEGVAKLMEQGNEIMMFLVNLVMKFAPFGTFGLIASAVGSMGWSALKAMLLYMLVVLLGLAVHLFVVYCGAIKFMANRNPITVLKAYLPAMAVSFSTSSSSATLPVAMEIAQKKLGVPRSISSFVQPLGATINMDGTAIMQGVATIFIAQVFQVDLTVPELVTVVLTAVLASVGTAAVPGAGLIMLAMVLTAVGLPVEGIALIIGIDRLLDMTRTMVNSTGDLTCALYVANSEAKKDAKLAQKTTEE